MACARRAGAASPTANVNSDEKRARSALASRSQTRSYTARVLPDTDSVSDIQTCEHRAVTLPADSHVHSEWSWDTGGLDSFTAGRMELMCERAAAIGLPAVVFTEYFDFDDAWRTTRDDLMPHQQSIADRTSSVS